MAEQLITFLCDLFPITYLHLFLRFISIFVAELDDDDHDNDDEDQKQRNHSHIDLDLFQ